MLRIDTSSLEALQPRVGPGPVNISMSVYIVSLRCWQICCQIFKIFFDILISAFRVIYVALADSQIHARMLYGHSFYISSAAELFWWHLVC